MVELGDIVRDKITGFQGTAVTKCIYLNGCISFEIQPKLNTKKEWVLSKWIDEPQLESVPKRVHKKPEPVEYHSGRGGPGNKPDRPRPHSLYSNGDRGN